MTIRSPRTAKTTAAASDAYAAALGSRCDTCRAPHDEGDDEMLLYSERADEGRGDIDRSVPPLTGEDRYLLATVCREARAHGWRSGHRLGWVHQRQGVAVSVEPGALALWWRGPGGRWPTYPRSYPVASLNEALHVLIGVGLLPGWYCDHGRQAMAEIAWICDRAADDLERRAVVALAGDEAVAARVWRQAAGRARRVAGLKAPA
ncbi:hypothetical protein [Actinoplanes sp. NPDC026623]|uniref:hypothetical protein n=1 Tax=Actinoplanes sp. NPDC026623 TaxID=3155610 RepID=UPI0033C54A94